jgi:hypothetical protein
VASVGTYFHPANSFLMMRFHHEINFYFLFPVCESALDFRPSCKQPVGSRFHPAKSHRDSVSVASRNLLEGASLAWWSPFSSRQEAETKTPLRKCAPYLTRLLKKTAFHRVPCGVLPSDPHAEEMLKSCLCHARKSPALDLLIVAPFESPPS